jgi:transposase
MNEESTVKSRVIGFDSHPDSFTAAVLVGSHPSNALVEKMFNKHPMRTLKAWVEKNITEHDVIVLEASGNSFQVARTIQALGRKVKVLESAQMGKLKEAHANNDKISATRIGKAYMAGTAKEVWIPDLKTQERRDCFHAHRKSVKRTTQLQNRLNSYLSDNGVRLDSKLTLGKDSTQEFILKAQPWSERQRRILEVYDMELRHAQEQRAEWESFIAQEVIDDPQLLSLVRLCGVRDIIAFSLGAIIGDINRFSDPKKLVKYVGLHPAFDDSGEGEWHGGIGGHGRSDLRALLIQAAQSIMRVDNPLATWGRKLMARKGSLNLAVAAVARKLTVAIWYLLKGQWTQLEEIEDRLVVKITKIISNVGNEKIRKLGKTRKDMRQEIYTSLKARTYILPKDPKMFEPRKAKAQPTPANDKIQPRQIVPHWLAEKKPVPSISSLEKTA